MDINALTNIITYYNNSQNDVYHFALGKLLGNIDLLMTGSIYEIADHCTTSTATISRLAQKLGYQNFTDLKHGLSEDLRNYPYSNRVIPGESSYAMESLHGNYFDSLRKTISDVEASISDESIARAVELIYGAKRVLLCTFDTGFADASLQINLMLTGKGSLQCDRFSEQVKAAKTLTSDDLAIIIAQDRPDAIDVLPLSQVLKDNNVKIILITNSSTCMHTKLADLSFTFDGTGSNLDFLGMHMVMDLINLKYRRLYVE